MSGLENEDKAKERSEMNRVWARKMIAILLVVIIFINEPAAALAESFLLPEDLTAIDAGAFEGIEAMNTVYVPWGTESIDSRAFADSGLQAIYLPDTVTWMADDTFAGSSVTIYSSENAYAREYAEAHNIPWENSYGDTEPPVSLEDVEPLDDIFIPYLEAMSTDGVTDEHDLELIQRYNNTVTEVNNLAWEYNWNSYYVNSSLSDEFQASASGYSTLSQTVDGDQSCWNLYGESYRLDRRLFDGQERSFVDVEVAENYVTLTDSDGETYQIWMPGNDDALSSNTIAKDAGKDSTLISISTDWLDQCVERMGVIKDWLGAVLNRIESEFSLVQQTIDQLNKEIKVYEGEKDNSFTRTMLKRMRDELETAKAKRVVLKAAHRTLKTIDIYSAYKTIRECCSKLKEMKEIGDHWHPNDSDKQSKSGQDIAKEMLTKGNELIQLYICDIVLTFTANLSTIATAITFIASKLSLAVPPFAAGLATVSVIGFGYSIAAAGIGTVIDLREEKSYEEVIALHKKLHTCVYGKVTHRANSQGMYNVCVSCGDAKTYTDWDGSYVLYVPGRSDWTEPVTLLFQDDEFFETPEYYSCSKDVTLKLNEGVPLDAELGEPFYVFGRVTERFQNIPLSGVKVTDGVNTVYTDKDGKYKIYTANDASLTFTGDNHDPRIIDVKTNGIYFNNGAYDNIDTDMTIMDWGTVELIGYIRPNLSESDNNPTIICGDQVIHPDANGWFRVTISNGITLYASCAGYSTMSFTFEYGRIYYANPLARYGIGHEEIDIHMGVDIRYRIW